MPLSDHTPFPTSVPTLVPGHHGPLSTFNSMSFQQAESHNMPPFEKAYQSPQFLCCVIRVSMPTYKLAAFHCCIVFLGTHVPSPNDRHHLPKFLIIKETQGKKTGPGHLFISQGRCLGEMTADIPLSHLGFRTE